MLKISEILGPEINKMNNDNLAKLKARVSMNKVTWILGAGISKSLGVPLWSECLLRMWASILMLEKDSDKLGQEFRNELKRLKSQIVHP